MTDHTVSEQAGPHTKVFGIGLSRTGSTSLHVASVMLGLPAVHYPAKMAMRWFLGDFSGESTHPFAVITDIPTPEYFEELDKTHPRARFVFTVRDLDSWLDSFEAHVRSTRRSSEKTLRRDIIRVACYGTVTFHRERMANVYLRHLDRVQTYFKHRASDLLVLDLKQEAQPWKKLCDFLDLPIPDRPFPHLRNPRIGSLRTVLPHEVAHKRDALIRLAFQEHGSSTSSEVDTMWPADEDEQS